MRHGNKIEEPSLNMDREALALEAGMDVNALVEEIVTEMNHEFWDHLSGDPLNWMEDNGHSPMDYMSNGSSLVIRFLDLSIWASDDDDRQRDNDGEPLITLHSHIRTLTDNTIKLISLLRRGE